MKRFLLGFASAMVLFFVLLVENVVCITGDYELVKSASYEKGYCSGYADGMKDGSNVRSSDVRSGGSTRNDTYVDSSEALETWKDKYLSDRRNTALSIIESADNSARFSNSSNSGYNAVTYTAPQPQERTVYITNTVTKYHRYGCRYLKDSCNSISISDAISRGYSACSVCGG